MALLQNALRVVAVLLCVVAFSDARADGYDYWVAAGQHGFTGAGAGIGAAEGAITTYDDPCSPGAPGPCTFSTNDKGACDIGQGANSSCEEIQVCNSNGYGSTCSEAGTDYEFTCNAGYQFNGDYSAPACLTACPSGQVMNMGVCVGNCQQQAGASDIMLASPGDYIGQTSCMQGCQVIYQAGTTISGSPSTSGSWGRWVVQGATGASGTACTTPQDTHQPAVPDPHGNVCDGTTCANMPANSICDAQGNCVSAQQLSSSDGCVTTPAGNMFCVSSAPTPPKPDDGTPGVPATPDGEATSNGQMCDGGGSCTVDSYSSSTVNNSSTHGGSSSGGSGAGASSGGPGGASSGASSGAGSSGSSGGGCSSSSSGGSGGGCNGFGGPGTGSVKDFGQSLQDFNNQIKASPLATAMNTLSDGVPSGGSLPNSCFSISWKSWNQQYCITVPDQLASNLDLLRLAFLAMWALVAIFVFFKA